MYRVYIEVFTKNKIIFDYVKNINILTDSVFFIGRFKCQLYVINLI